MIKALFGIYFIWGFNWVVMKEANSFFPPDLFVTYRFALGALVLLAVSGWLRLPIPPRRYWKWIIVTGVMQIAIGNVAVQEGMVDLGAGLAAVLNYSMPMWVAIMAHFLLGERLTRRKVVGIVISMVGLAVLMKVDTLGSVSAILLTVGGAIAWAVSSIIVKIQNRVMERQRDIGTEQDCNIIQYTTWQMVTGCAALAIYTGITGTGTVQWTPMAVACLAYNGLLASALAFFLWNYLLSRMEAGKASVAILATPIVGVIGGILCLGEQLYWTSALGMVLILAGILLIVKEKIA